MGQNNAALLLLVFFLIIVGMYAVIIMEPPEDQLEVASGTDFVLTCKGDLEVTWRYQNSTTKTLKTSVIDGMHAAQVVFHGVNYKDTGYYYCSSIKNKSEEIPLYLYVRDGRHLLTQSDEDPQILSPSQYHDIIIPCRPTSPDINVTLYKDDEEVKPVSYDPREGFTISNVVVIDSGDYKCKATRHGSLSNPYEANFQVRVHPPTEGVPKPTITVHGYEGNNIIVGEDITLSCSVIIDVGVQVILQWTIPKNVNTNNFKFSQMHMDKVIIRGKEKLQAILNLDIKKVVITDAGRYICNVTDHSANTNEEYFNLKILSVDTKFLNLTMEGNKEVSVRVTEEKEAQWIVDIDGYPRPSFEWYGPDMKLLSDFNKYTLSNTHHTKASKVTVHNLTIQDSGVYTLHARSSYKNETLKVTLLVEDKPTVSFIHTSKYYDINQKEKLECTVIAYPIPNIEWNFVECTDYTTFCARKSALPAKIMKAEPLVSENLIKWRSTAECYTLSSGIITCRADNHLGVAEAHMNLKITDVKDGFEIRGPKHRVLSSDDIIISCGASRYEYNDKFDWIYNSSKNGQDTLVEFLNNTSRKGISIYTNQTSFSHRSTLHLDNVTPESSGSYKCRVKSFIENVYKEKEFILQVQSRRGPSFTNFTNLNGSTVTVKVGKSVSWNCSVVGMPEPEVIWFKDGKAVDTKTSRIQFVDQKNHTILIPFTDYEDGGTYKCEATNSDGKISAYNTLKLKGTPLPSKAVWWVFVVLVICLCLVTLILLAFWRKLKKEKEKRKQLISVGLYNFSEGQTESIKPNVDIGEQADLLPYDKKWEFPRDKLKLGKQLGFGAFGIVVKAEALVNSESITVAVKMVKRSSDPAHIKSLAGELKIMANLGQHLNVVNLIGACTANIHKREILVIVEYCRYGNLHQFLLNHRNNFVDQVNPDTGSIDVADRYVSTELTYIKPGLNQGSSAAVSNYSNGRSVHTEMTSISTPVGEDGYLLNRDEQLTAAYQTDYKVTNIRPIKTVDLFCWCYQVAKGMEYLASRKIIHGDLAARNILLSEGNIAKISDFGLAKNIYSKENYKNPKRGIPLPVKWMALEAIRDGVFSTQGDIWSYGIFLWEVFSLAITPYPGIYGEEFFSKIQNGYRMERPKYSTSDIYNLMLECWKDQPMLRPNFGECSARAGRMLGESVKQHYLDLNSAYMEASAKGENDILSRLMEPSYENCIQSGMDSTPYGYVCMKAPERDAVNEMELRPMITPALDQEQP